MQSVLIVDDEVLCLRAIARELKGRGWTVTTTQTVPGPGYLPGTTFDVVLADWEPHGPAVLGLAQAAGVPVVVYTGRPDLPQLGCPVLAKPAPVEALDQALRAAVNQCRRKP